MSVDIMYIIGGQDWGIDLRFSVAPDITVRHGAHHPGDTVLLPP
jgi:hypothetical protein